MERDVGQDHERGNEWEDKQEEEEEEEGERMRRRKGHRPKAAAVEGVVDETDAGVVRNAVEEGKGDLDSLDDDVTRPMPRRESGRGVSGGRSAAEGGRGARGRGAKGGSGPLKLRQQRKRPELLLEDGGEEAFVSSMVEGTEDPDGWKDDRRGDPDERPGWEAGGDDPYVGAEAATAAGATTTATAAPTPW